VITRTWKTNGQGIVILEWFVLGVLVYRRALLPWEHPIDWVIDFDNSSEKGED